MMTLADAALISQIVGAVAVVASLLFVGVQLRQNTLAVKASMSQAHAAMWVDINARIVDNAEFAATWVTGLAEPHSLSVPERAQFVALLSSVFRFYEASRVQWRKGKLDPELWSFVEAHARAFRGLVGVKYWWEMRRRWHSEEFRLWFDALQPTHSGELYDVPSEAAPVEGVAP